MNRPTKRDYYMQVAEAIAQRSPCLKMQVGAVLVKDDVIISTGYNGPVRGSPHCEKCARENLPSKSTYGPECPAVHAEENAVINAARAGHSTLGSILYLWTSRKVGNPCYRCSRVLKNAGVEKIIAL